MSNDTVSCQPTIRFSPDLDEAARTAVLASQKFTSFMRKACTGFDIRGVDVLEVVWFGPGRVGMILVRTDATTRQGQAFPGSVAFIRGDSACVLVVLVDPDGAEWSVLVNQPRLCTGHAAFAEIPAGMVDEGEFHSTALRELQEEVGTDLGIVAADLQPLRVFYPSPGACDESIALYAVRKNVEHSLVKLLQGRQAGATEEGEHIGIELVALASMLEHCGQDAKSVIAYYDYAAHRAGVRTAG